MSAALNNLLLAALQRAGKPQASDDLLDAAVGLGLAEGWEPADVCLSRRSVAARLKNMEASGLVKCQGVRIDDSNRQTTPTYVPVGGYNPNALVPPPPERAAKQTTTPTTQYDGMSRSQLIALLEIGDDIAGEVSRFMVSMERLVVRSKRRLIDVQIALETD